MTQAITSQPRSALRTNRVLFATTSERPAATNLQRAQDLADRASSELHLLRVMSQRELSRASTLGSESVLARFIDAARATSHHCREVLSDRFADESLVLAVGSLRDSTAIHAAEIDAGLLVLPGGELRGRDVTALARSAERPVLVLRPKVRGARAVVAATDLTQDFPVLRTARELAALRGSSSVALHALRSQRVAVAVAAQLKRAAGALGFDASALVPARDPVSAILEEAGKRAADVIVVGTHARTAWRRALRSSVAVRLIDRAQRSVWVEPIVG